MTLAQSHQNDQYTFSTTLKCCWLWLQLLLRARVHTLLPKAKQKKHLSKNVQSSLFVTVRLAPKPIPVDSSQFISVMRFSHRLPAISQSNHCCSSLEWVCTSARCGSCRMSIQKASCTCVIWLWENTANRVWLGQLHAKLEGMLISMSMSTKWGSVQITWKTW